MSEQCLVTKLKGTISNSELIPLGALRLEYKNNEYGTTKSQSFSLKVGNEDVTIVVSGNNSIQTSSGLSGKTVIIPANSSEVSVTVPNVDCFIDILPCYKIEYLTLGGSGSADEFNYKTIVNPESIKYLTQLQVVNLNEYRATTIMTKYFASPSISILIAGYCNIKGDLALLGAENSLKYLSLLVNDGVYGDLASLIGKIVTSNGELIDVRYTPNVVKKRSTINTLESYGFTVLVTDEEVTEDV